MQLRLVPHDQGVLNSGPPGRSTGLAVSTDNQLAIQGKHLNTTQHATVQPVYA